MQTISVYHSIWKGGLLVASCLVLATFGIYDIDSSGGGIISWLCALFFGIGGLFMLGLMLKERITKTPYYLITDDSITFNGSLKACEIRFADVERFYLTNVGTTRGKTQMIGIQYKKDVEFQKFENADKAGRSVRRFNMSVTGFQEALPADGLTIKSKDLCEILNERVQLLQNSSPYS